MSGRREQDILWLERRYWQLPDLAGIEKRLAALEQGLAASWMLAGTKQTTTCDVSDFAAVCPCMPATITLNDSFYGNVTLTYVPASLAWFGCSIWTLPTSASCTGPITFALHYTLTGSNSTNAWSLTCQYKSTNATTHCPVASICSDAPNTSLNLTMNVNCSGTSSVTFVVNGTTPGTQAWPVFRNVTLSFTLP